MFEYYSNYSRNVTEHQRSEDSDPRSTVAVAFQAGFLVLVILSSVVGNALILLAIYRNHRLRSITSVFIASLAVADLGVALIGMPFTLVSSITYTWIFGEFFCKINGLTNSIFCISSMLNLAAVSIDRYIAIIKPLNYPLIMTPRKAFLMLLHVWVQALLCAILPLLGWSQYTYITNESICTADWGADIPYTMFIFGSCFFVPLAIMGYCYYHILRAARRHSEKAKPTIGKIGAAEAPLRAALSLAVHADGTLTLDNSPEGQKEKEAKEKFKRDAKAAKTLLIVMGTFILCWLPHFMGMTCLLFDSCEWPDEFFATTTWLAMFNSGCNPIIYGVLNKRFRQTYKDILCCRRNTYNGNRVGIC